MSRFDYLCMFSLNVLALLLLDVDVDVLLIYIQEGLLHSYNNHHLSYSIASCTLFS